MQHAAFSETVKLLMMKGAHLLLQLLLVIRLPLGANHDNLDIFIVVDTRDLIVGSKHVLVQQIADGEHFRMIADRHHRDDLLRIQEQGQRPLMDHRHFDRIPVLIDAFDRPR